MSHPQFLGLAEKRLFFGSAATLRSERGKLEEQRSKVRDDSCLNMVMLHEKAGVLRVQPLIWVLVVWSSIRLIAIK